MPDAHAPDDVKVHVRVESLSIPADQSFREARADADNSTWETVTTVSLLEGEPVTDLARAVSLAKEKASRELLFGSDVAVAVPTVLPDFGEAWMFVWFGWK